MTSNFGLTSAGFKTMRLPNIKSSLDDAFIAQFGDINLDAGTVAANIIAPFSQAFASIWENMDDVYQSQYPSSAYGTSLDRLCQLNGITRLAATQTQVQAVCYGRESTSLPTGTQASIPSTGEIFESSVDGIITQSAAVYALLQIESLTDQKYEVSIDAISYFYSLPQIVFSDDFGSDNIIAITLNEVTLASVPYNTDQATTMADLAAELEAQDSIDSVAISNSDHTLTITPALGYENSIDSVVISGTSTPSVSYSFDTPATLNDITENLCAVINAANINITATDNADGTFSLQSDIVSEAMSSFSLINGDNILTTNRASQILFNAQNYGTVAAAVNSLTNIVTPTYGFTAINNLIAGVTGRNIETDSELRIRRRNSITIGGLGTVEAIRSRLLQYVPNVQDNGVFIFENTSIDQEDGYFTLNSNLVSGDDIVVEINGVTLPTITYASSSAATMTLLAALISTQDNVESAVAGGTDTRTITINWKSSTVNTINNVTVSPSSNQVFISDGRPPKSFEAVVQGGLASDIGEQIWLSKPAGIQTFGQEEVTVTDSQGIEHAIFFSRPSDSYIWVDLELTLTGDGTFPSNGISLVQDAIVSYGNGLGIGENVYIQRVLSQIFNVPGIASGSIEMASTLLETSTPSFSSGDITILESGISVWDVGRINVTVA